MSNNEERVLYVSFGFDDNGIPESLNWASETLNRYGSASFLIFSNFFTEVGIITAWRDLLIKGHNVGNHTHFYSFG